MIAITNIFILSLTLHIAGCGKAPDMPDFSNKKKSIELLNAKDEIKFSNLPTHGAVKGGERLWSGDYWPLNRGNINFRWSAPIQMGFNLVSPNRDVAMMLSTAEISELSPTEKFDLLFGRYHYPLKKEVSTRANRSALDWEGICNGWAAAAMNHNEPRPKELTNPDGIIIPFGSSDIKALISYYYAFIHQVQSTHQIGRRCPRGSRWFNWNADCKNDLNPGPFHIVLANKVGKQKKSFMADINRYKEVWNHPVHSYSSVIRAELRLPRRLPEPETARIIRVKTLVTYVDGAIRNTWYPLLGTPDQRFINRDYIYDLYLDKNDEIIGGKWISEERPDFLWTMEETAKFTGILNGLHRLLND